MKAALLVVLVIGTACIPSQNTRPQIGARPGDGGREMPPAMTAPRSGLTSKKVSGKEDPDVLFAADRTRCTVSVEKYREVSIGESVFCAWGNQ